MLGTCHMTKSKIAAIVGSIVIIFYFISVYWSVEPDTFSPKQVTEELTNKSKAALDSASLRVEERFGFQCTAAETQRDKILAKAAYFEANQEVEVLGMRDHPA